MRLELRFAPEARIEGRTLFGLACPFNRTASIDGGAYKEVVLPGAFTRSLAAGDVCALKDHDGGALLGRTRSGSLVLTETADGLQYTLALPATADGDALAFHATRGDLAGCSVGFRVPAGGEEWDGPRKRTLRAVDLHHIAIISGGVPCYDGTTANIRSQARPAAADALRRRRWLAVL